MNSLFLKTNSVLPVIIAGLVAATTLTSARDNAGADKIVTADSVRVNKPKMHSRVGWEEALFLPGRLVYVPIKYPGKALGFTIGWIDRTKIIARIDDYMTSDDGRRGVKLTYADRTGGGTFYYQKGLGGVESDRNILELTTTVGRLGSQRYRVEFDDFVPIETRYSSNFTAFYRRLTSEPFHGLGSDSRYNDRSNYTQEEWETSVGFGRELAPGRTVVSLGFGGINTGPGRDTDEPSTTDMFTSTNLPGLSENLKFVRIGVDYAVEHRNRPGNPTKGYDADILLGWTQQVNGSAYGFSSAKVDLSGYLELLYDRVIVLRTAAELRESSSDRKIPFYHLSELGRKESIRGFARGRFRDNDMLMGSLEYRYPVWRNWHEKGLDLVLFIDTGQVSDDLFSNAALDRFETGVGFGVRLWDHEDGLIGKLEAGHSGDGWRIYFVLN